MLLAYCYLLLFLLHLSASTCDATSRNHQHLFVRHAPSPAIQHDHRHAASKDLSYYDPHYYPTTMMARRGGPPPPPSLLPGVEAGGGSVGGGAPPPPPEEEANSAAKMEPSPSYPREVVVDGEQEESETDDVGVDYAGPKTHPPSHN